MDRGQPGLTQRFPGQSDVAATCNPSQGGMAAIYKPSQRGVAVTCNPGQGGVAVTYNPEQAGEAAICNPRAQD